MSGFDDLFNDPALRLQRRPGCMPPSRPRIPASNTSTRTMVDWNGSLPVARESFAKSSVRHESYNYGRAGHDNYRPIALRLNMHGGGSAA